MLHCKLENGAGLAQALGKGECESISWLWRLTIAVDVFSLGSSDSWERWRNESLEEI